MLPNRRIIASILLALPLVSLANKDLTKYSAQAKACLEEYELNHFEMALTQCQPLADKNDPLAQYVVAMLYKRGKAVKESSTAAEHWLSRSAEGGYAAAQLRLGKILSAGTSASPDYAKAAEYFNRAALQDDRDAQFLLALCYQNGIGVTKNNRTALSWYNKAIQNGLDAPVIVDKPVAKVKNRTLPDDFVWLKLAAEQGDSEAQFQVALHYANGQDTAQDDAQAIEWLQKAASNNNQNAMSYLAWMSMLGLGAPQNTELAIQWFVNAYEANDKTETIFSLSSPPSPPTSQQEAKARTVALYDQAIRLLDNHMDDDSIKLGVKLLESAAKNNHGAAQAKLAQLYQTGKGVTQSKEKAAKWFEKGAKNGNSDAQYALGWIYFNGEGTNKNIVQSYYWFNQASAFGGARAKTAKQFVRSQMNADQLAKVDKLTGQVAAK